MMSRVALLAFVGVLVTHTALNCSEAKSETSKSHGKKLDLKYVPDDAVAAMVGYPSRVLTAPGMELLPIEALKVAAKKHAGFDPMDLEQVLGVLAPPEPGERAPRAAVVLTFSKPIDLADVASKILPQGSDVEIDGHRGRSSPRASDVGACVIINDRTLILGSSVKDLHWALSGKTEGSPLRTLMSGANDAPDAAFFLAATPLREWVRSEMKRAIQQKEDIHAPIIVLASIPDMVETVEMCVEGFGLDQPGKLTAQVTSDESSAQELEVVIKEALETGRGDFLAQMSAELNRGDDRDINEAMMRYLTRMSDKVVTALRPKREKNILSFEVELQSGVTALSVLTFLRMPALQASQESARRAEAARNMKEIGDALEKYEKQQKRVAPVEEP